MHKVFAADALYPLKDDIYPLSVYRLRDKWYIVPVYDAYIPPE